MTPLKPILKYQRGFTLVELAIYAVIAAMMAAGALYYQASELRYQVARAQVDQLRVLRTGLNKYQSKYSDVLISGGTIPQVAVPQAPTLPELKALGLLDSSIGNVSLYSGGGYATSIRKVPAGCVASGCSLFGLVYLTSPVVDANGRVDNAALGEAITYGGGYVGASNDLDKTTIRGSQGMWSVASPLPAMSGVLAMRVLDDSVAYLPLDGSQAMRGDLNMGTKSISNAANISASGSVVAGNVQAAGAVSGATLTASGAITGAAVTATGTVQGYNVNAANLLMGQGLSVSGSISGRDIYATNSINSGWSVNAPIITASSAMYTGSLTTSNGANINGETIIKGQTYVMGNLAAYSDWWAIFTRDANAIDVSAPQNTAGSLNVNDIYLRSVGKWASEMATPPAPPGIPCVSYYDSNVRLYNAWVNVFGDKTGLADDLHIYCGSQGTVEFIKALGTGWVG